MNTDKSDLLKQKIQPSFLSVLVVNSVIQFPQKLLTTDHMDYHGFFREEMI